jgi:hypothetical protein
VVLYFALVPGAFAAAGPYRLAAAPDALARRPFRRASVLQALFGHLGIPAGEWCCIEGTGMPQIFSEGDDEHNGIDTAATSADLKLFQRYCGACHHEHEPFPPNFLHGSPAQVQEQIDHCAQRILFRLEMWGLPPGERPEAPMPPAVGLARLNVAPERWPGHSDLAKLKAYVAQRANSDGRMPPPTAGRSQEYDSLPECLPRPASSARERSHARQPSRGAS